MSYTGNIGNKPIVQTNQESMNSPEAEKAASTVNLLFERLSTIYTSFRPTVAKIYGHEANKHMHDLKAEWTKQFISEKLEIEDIKRGLESARKTTNSFFPKCSIFIEWCKGFDQNKINKSWSHYLNRRIGEKWDDPMTFEAAKRVGCGCNELIANLSGNNTEKARQTFTEKYTEILDDIKNGFKLPELRLVLEHKTGSNKNRTAEDKERITKTDGYAAFQKLIKGNK